jgi:hypothetical protein
MQCPMWLIGLGSVGVIMLALGGLLAGLWFLLRRRVPQS